MEESMSHKGSLFARVATKSRKMDNKGGLEAAGKLSRGLETGHAGTNGHPLVDVSSDSSDEEFEKFVVHTFTPKTKVTSRKPLSAAKTDNTHILVESSEDEDDFERFLDQMRTPVTNPKTKPGSGSEDSLKNFIVDELSSDDDFTEPKPSFRVPKTRPTPATRHPFRKPLTEFNSPVFVSDSEDEDDVIIRSSWKTRHAKPKPHLKTKKLADDKNGEQDSSPSPPVPLRQFLFDLPCSKAETPSVSPSPTLSAPSRLDESSSSGEEFASLLERLKKKHKLTGSSFSPRTSEVESDKENAVSAPATKPFITPTFKTPKGQPQPAETKGQSSIVKPKVSQTEPRHGSMSRLVLCKTPGCFLQSLTNPGSTYGAAFKTNKEELTSKLYRMYNTSVFDNKLPTNMSVTWNKKMRKTAGHCITGQEKNGGSRYARIELSVKVCDSADRLRDTLIHEMCHAATWLINGIRDGHGNLWKCYARKATQVHPELPMVTRCHSYDIKYKFQYQCTRCQNTIGRHSKSLDTQRFVCALCTGQLTLLTPSKPRAPTPFADFVKQNYGGVRQELSGQSHAEVMRKLSADFAKTKISES
nr:germ cell nuclear acidic protein isoform X1 [Nothobranchius furzeri]